MPVSGEKRREILARYRGSKKYDRWWREYQWRTKYGIDLTVEQYDAMYRAQSGRCAICRRRQAGRRLSVDHSHKTKRLRALLCSRCNHAIGLLRDDPSIVRSAADYLEEHLAD